MTKKNPHAVALGKKGGKVKSDAKTAAARANAKRPRKGRALAIAWIVGPILAFATGALAAEPLRYAKTPGMDRDFVSCWKMASANQFEGPNERYRGFLVVAAMDACMERRGHRLLDPRQAITAELLIGTMPRPADERTTSDGCVIRPVNLGSNTAEQTTCCDGGRCISTFVYSDGRKIIYEEPTR